MTDPNSAAAKPDWKAELELDRQALAEAVHALREHVRALPPIPRIPRPRGGAVIETWHRSEKAVGPKRRAAPGRRI